MTRFTKTLSRCVFATCLSVLAPAVAAAPYCKALLDADALPEKYASLAPVYSSADTGWIFAANQMRQSFALKDKPKAMMAEIVQGFEAKGVKLAILITPPRPVVAGQGILRKTMGAAAADYDATATQASFQAMLAEYRDMGAIVPDLSVLALSDPQLRRRFYFRRDTHWTTVGAAHSAEALAQAVAAEAPKLRMAEGPAILGWKGKIEERGSLADLVRKSCDQKVPKETSNIAVLADVPGAGLLDDTEGPQIALVGTSFSDRYKRDHYRVADAMAAAFGRSVVNHSVSGGGLHRAMQSFLNAGGLDNQAYDLVIWEIPYTQNFNSTKRLGAVLKAMKAAQND